MSSTAYVTIRDDAGASSSLSVNEREFLRTCALKGAKEEQQDEEEWQDGSSHQKMLRVDGRRGHDVRNIQLRLHRWDNGSETTVQWGAGTRVSACCSAELLPPPNPDRPNEGMVVFEVDLSPMASPGFRLAPAVSTGGSGGGKASSSSANFSNQEQRLQSNRILRCLERIIVMGGALDTEALVLEGGKWVWKLTLSVTVLDAGGNILDASVLAAVAALRHYRKPQVDMTSSVTAAANNDNENTTTDNVEYISLPTLIPSTLKEATPLPLHHSPLSISFGLIPADDAVSSTSSTSIVAALMDPTDREELVQSGSLTIAMNIHSEICLLDYGGGCELMPQQLKECCRAAQPAIQSLCQLLEKTLSEADEQAQMERLRLLQLQQQAGDAFGNNNGGLPPLPSNTGVPITMPFLQQLDDQLDVDAKVDEAQVDHIQTAAEEAYRKQALDYASGHVTMAVRENNDRKQNNRGGRGEGNTAATAAGSGSSLLASMLKSVGQHQQQPIEQEGNADMNQESASIISSPALPPTNRKEVLDVAVSDVAKNATPASKPVAMDIDGEDDEEEETTMLQTEFEPMEVKQQQPPQNQPKEPPQQTETLPEEDDDIDDLAMAIKSKKSKKKKSKNK